MQMTFYLALLCLIATVTVAQQPTKQQAFNPYILEDARVHPTSDGSFGFLYRTEDGISHAAKGVPGGAVQGRFTYTDPTGLKVNFNYNAGAQALKQPQEPAQQTYQQPAPKYTQSYEKPRSRYVVQEPQVQYQPEPAYEQPRYQPQPRQNSYSQNYVNDDYQGQYYQ